MKKTRTKNFFPSRSEAEKFAGSKKNFFFAYQPCSKGTFFLYTDKIQIKKLLDYSASIRTSNVKQISSFIYAFDGEIYSKLKNIHIGKPPLVYKKVFLIRLHSSTFVQ